MVGAVSLHFCFPHAHPNQTFPTMGILSRIRPNRTTSGTTLTNNNAPPNVKDEKALVEDDTPVRIFRLRILAMGLIVSLGGMIFG